MAPRWPARASSLGCVFVVLAAASGDDVLSEEHFAELHPKIDTNSDGKVTLSELKDFAAAMRKSAREQEVQNQLPTFDEDGDGKVSRSEFFAKMSAGEEDGADPGASDEAEQVKGLFAAADTNGDGILELEEFKHIYHADGNPAMLELAGRSIIKEYDSNGDGVVSPEEFTVSGDEVDMLSFYKLDSDGDKRLSALEIAPLATGVLGEHLDLEETVRRADSDGDGHLTLEELKGAREHISGTLLSSWALGPKDEL